MASYYGSSSCAGAFANPAGAFSNPDDGPGSASSCSNHFHQAPSDRLLAYMESCHVGSWHLTLNNHASTRPKCYGGATVPSLSACNTFTPPGSASASWQCVLDLPNSFTKDDGIRLCVSSEAPTKNKADQDTCRLAFTLLLMQNPGQVVLRPAHWNVSIENLLANMPDSVPPHQALPVHVNAKRARMDGESAAEQLSDPPHVWEGRIVELLREILNRHGGSFDPSYISHYKMGRASGDQRAYEELNRLLKPNELKAFVEQHPEFAWESTGKKGMIIKWG